MNNATQTMGPHEKKHGDSVGQTYQNYQHADHPATGLKRQDNDLVVIMDVKLRPCSTRDLSIGEALNLDAIH